MFLLKKLIWLNDGKTVQSIDLIETYTWGTNKSLIIKKEGIKCNNAIKQCKDNYFWWYYKR